MWWTYLRGLGLPGLIIGVLAGVVVALWRHHVVMQARHEARIDALHREAAAGYDSVLRLLLEKQQNGHEKQTDRRAAPPGEGGAGQG